MIKFPTKDWFINKLNYYGIRDKNLNWITYFLGNRQQQVLLNGIASSKLSIDSGVPQGTVLDPTLFLLFINDLPEHVNCNVRLYADDCLLYRNVNNQSDSELLQKDLTNVENWEDMADEVQPGKMLCYPCYQEENSP